MTKSKSLFVIAAACLLIGSCKKEDTPATTTTTTTTTTNTSDALCKGDGSTAYIPLKLGNSWTLYDKTYQSSEVLTIVGTKVMNNSLTYFKASYTNKSDYYRQAANGDIYCWYTSSFDALQANEVLLIPANPKVGQGWANPNNFIDSTYVNSINASITSSNGCTYTGVLELYEYTSGSLFKKDYYKKGIGKIQTVTTGFGASTRYLKAVTLK